MTIDINTFCKLPVPVQSDSDGTSFLLTAEVLTLLSLAEDPADLPARRNDCGPSQPSGDIAAGLWVSESDLNRMLLGSRAEAVRPFMTWVCDVLVPTLTGDGIYTLQEELLYSPPDIEEYRPTHDDLWDDDAPDDIDARALAEEMLRALRRDECVTFGHGALIGGQEMSSNADLAFSAQRKRQRLRTDL